MGELARSSVALLADLFERIDPEFPLDNLVFANRLEQFCNWTKTGGAVDDQNNETEFKEAYDLCSFYGESSPLNLPHRARLNFQFFHFR